MTTPTIEKATLTLYRATSEGRVGGKLPEELKFQFNPKEYTIKKGASWERKPARGARSAAMPEFKGAEPATMSIECFLDASESPSGSITKDLETLYKCCTPVGESVDRDQPSPPFVAFAWGTTMRFTAFVKSVSARYTMFRPDGTPTRALATIEFEEIPTAAGTQNPTSGGAARRTHTVLEGDSLQSVAYREYGDPTLWRALAEANSIDDPMRLRAGSTLLVPRPGEAAEYA